MADAVLRQRAPAPRLPLTEVLGATTRNALADELLRQRAALGGRGVEALPLAAPDELLAHAARCLLAYELRKAAGGD